MKVDVGRIVRELVGKTVHMSLATASDGKPWVCEVHFAYDKHLNLYFVSLADTRHSQEIRNNEYVAGNIIRQHELSEYPAGVYFEGQAEELHTPTDNQISLYCRRLDRDANEVKEMTKPENSSRMYKIVVTNWAIFGKFDGSDKGKKFTLAWNEDRHES